MGSSVGRPPFEDEKKVKITKGLSASGYWWDEVKRAASEDDPENNNVSGYIRRVVSDHIKKESQGSNALLSAVAR